MGNKKWRGFCVYVREEMVRDCGVLRLAGRIGGVVEGVGMKEEEKKSKIVAGQLSIFNQKY